MVTFQILYEYCDTHGSCDNPACRKTVVIHVLPETPKINLMINTLLHRTGDAERGTPTKGSPRGYSWENFYGRTRWILSRFLIDPTEIFSRRQNRKRTRPHATQRRFPRFSSPFPRFLNMRYAFSPATFIGLMILTLGIGGIMGPLIPRIRLESSYLVKQAQSRLASALDTRPPLPQSAPIIFEPLLDANGAPIAPINEDFAVVIPKIGVNAPVIANVDPTNLAAYQDALKNGVAHAATSFLPDGDGTVYLFSHSTNYDWFVRDLNAIFYLLKNLDEGDTIVLLYNRKRYTYTITGKEVVGPKDTSYLYPSSGKRSLILQTCWPPGSTAERLLIFADLVQEENVI
jgi:LPXTG-site transpeptidase (sortase) family protein